MQSKKVVKNQKLIIDINKKLLNDLKRLYKTPAAHLMIVLLVFGGLGASLVLTSQADSSAQPLGAGESWSQIWSDEFTGTALDTNKWNNQEAWHSAPGYKFVDADTWCPLPMPSNFAVVNNGTLKMNLYNQAAGGQPTQACELNTRNKFQNFTQGYIEARIKSPPGADLWTAFWLMGNGTGTESWPKTGEIDIFEFVNNGTAHGTPFFSTHWAGPCDAWSHCDKTQDSPWPSVIPDWSNKFVTYGLKRTSSALEVYIDGVFKYRFTPETKNKYGQTMPSYIFSGEMHTILTIKSGGGWGNDPNKPPAAGTMEVDYVRAWVPSSSSSDTTAPTVSLTSPGNGSVISGTANVAASASDNVGVSKVEFFVNGSLRNTDTTNPYAFSLDTTTLTNASHTLTARAYDAAGNVANSNVTVTVNNPTASLPDVVVSAVNVTPASPKSGDQVIFSAVIQNQGSGPTPAGVPVGVRYDVNGMQTHWAATTALAAGESRTVTATNSMMLPDVNYWTAVAGSHSLEAWVDDVNRFTETNETNNKLSKSFSVGSTTARISQTGNLATSKAFTSNVGTIDGTAVAWLNDQNEATRWISATQDNVWIKTDLGKTYNLSKVSVLWAGDTTKNYDLQISSDNINWTTIFSGTTNNTTPQLIDTTSFIKSAQGRYFRILAKDRWNIAYGNSMWELGIYGTETNTTTGNGDANGDGRVNAVDLSIIISKDGQNYPAADFNNDGTVGAADMAVLLSKWTW